MFNQPIIPILFLDRAHIVDITRRMVMYLENIDVEICLTYMRKEQKVEYKRSSVVHFDQQLFPINP